MGEGEILSLHWDPVVPLQWSLLKCAIPGMQHAPLKTGREGASRSGISRPQLISSPLTVLPPLANMGGTHNQGRFLKLQPH